MGISLQAFVKTMAVPFFFLFLIGTLENGFQKKNRRLANGAVHSQTHGFGSGSEAAGAEELTGLSWQKVPE